MYQLCFTRKLLNLKFNNPAEVLQGSSQANAGFFFSLPTSTPPHPPTTQIDGLWSVFVQNVDPLTKVFHVPTLKPAFHHASRKIEAVPARFEALMFAIYSAAVMSLTDTECQSRFQEPREVMRRKFINATQVALSHANFIATKGLVVLQALVLHIISAADVYEPRALWTLTGVAVRLASGMGIDRDGTILGLSPFDTEIRRRVWWIINALDIRSAELCGLPKFRGMDLSAQAPKRPADVNDADIYPHMPAIPRDSECMTDATFISIRYDLLGFAGASVSQFRHLDKDPGQWDEELASKDQGTQEIEEHLETKYLRHCDPSQPLQLLSMLMARSAVDTIRFMTHHPRRWAAIDQAPPSERQFLWDVCIRLLEQRNMLQSTPLLDRFAWQAPFVIQWSAFIHVLDCLLTSPHGPDVDRAWLLVGETFRNNPKILGDWSKSLHWVVGSLCLRAYEARAAEEPTPDFILMLRGARDALAASQRPEPEISNTSGRLSSGDSHSSSTDGELIGLINSLDGGMTDDGFVSNNMDLPIYAEGLDSINWEQWDSLLEASHTQ